MSSLPGGNNQYLGQSIRLAINDPSAVSEARRVGATLAQQLGMNEEMTGRVSLVVSEAASNIVHHAKNGVVILRKLTRDGKRGVEMLALDKGPGMANVSQCMEDRYTTRGTQGIGLGTMKRMSALFDIHSQLGVGTGVLAVISEGTAAVNPGGLAHGAVSLPVSGEQVCGDAWAVHSTEEQMTVVVADGLGHGAFASEAAQEALRVFDERIEDEPGVMVQAMHGALKKTRGAAAAVARIDIKKKEVRFAGGGNIAGWVIQGGKGRSMVSMNGTLGHQLQRVQQFSYPWSEDSVVVLGSDGLSSQWSLSPYGPLAQRHPALIAGTLVRDHSRLRDDVTVVAIGRE